MKKPIIALTPGDATGIGPEVLAKALIELKGEGLPYHLLVVGDVRVVQKGAEIAHLSLKINPIEMTGDARFDESKVDVLDSKNLPSISNLEMGRIHPECGRAMVEDIRIACTLANAGVIHGVVGGPHNKKAPNAAGIHFEGYPHFLQEFTGAKKTYGVLMVGKFRITSVTLHVGLREVPSLLTTENVYHAVKTFYQAIRESGVEQPRLVVSGFNPHAGEEGLFGDEEITGIMPAIKKAQNEGMNVEGPLPADSLFYGFPDHPRWDGYLTMYHDQSHLPVKTVAFDRSAAQHIGTSILFTTVSHGTAFDIAGQGRANHRAMIEAIRIAGEGAIARQKAN